ncbi:hypothetical protein FYJ38_00485 [Clostridium sp. WB02_MRS01]|uniref:hypothetical protein n=1 Tax=Clostridium sp. WB02_MRS01 TaxID=2605777 RepID=UPI0012B192A9|nr:hypothetical protein [Clostridium sp. WB02_MRS01]MSS07116.1 hypothetical protein [Clostridium sp. WB02_MRS01]
MSKLLKCLLLDLIIGVILGSVYYLTYLCSNPNKLNHYGEEDYAFSGVIVGSGKNQKTYFGSISDIEYKKWENGNDGTLWLESCTRKGYGYRINIDSITTIVIYEDDWVPLNFYY